MITYKPTYAPSTVPLPARAAPNSRAEPTERRPPIAAADPIALLATVRGVLANVYEDVPVAKATLDEALTQIDATLDANTIPALTPERRADAAALAHDYVRVGRIKKRAAATVKAANDALAAMVDPILDHMKHHRWPSSGKVEGANLHRKLELYASPAEVQINGEFMHDHAGLTAVIQRLAESEPENNWAALLPGKVNSNSLAGTFREYLRNADFTPEQQLLDVRERLIIAGCPVELIDAAKITEKHTVNANGL